MHYCNVDVKLTSRAKKDVMLKKVSVLPFIASFF